MSNMRRVYRVTLKYIREETWWEFDNEHKAVEFMINAYEHGEKYTRYTLTIEEKEDDF